MKDQPKRPPADFGALVALLFFAFACGVYAGGWITTHVELLRALGGGQ